MTKITATRNKYDPSPFVIDSMGLPIKDMADMCEEAHRLTVAECEKRKIELETYVHEDTNDLCYTAEAQKIFDRIYTRLEAKTQI